MSPQTNPHLVKQATGIFSGLLSKLRGFDTDTLEGEVLDVVHGHLEVSLNGDPVNVVGQPIETVLKGDHIFIRRLQGATWSLYLYDGFFYRGDAVVGDSLYYTPRVQNTLQIVSTATAGTIVRLGVDFASQVVRWRLTCENSASCSFDIQAGSDELNVAPTFTSICGGNYPTLTTTTYAVNNTLTGWLPLLADRTLLRIIPLSNADVTGSNPVTLLLTVERR